jgi:hypothetical protein
MKHWDDMLPHLIVPYQFGTAAWQPHGCVYLVHEQPALACKQTKQLASIERQPMAADAHQYAD